MPVLDNQKEELEDKEFHDALSKFTGFYCKHFDGTVREATRGLLVASKQKGEDGITLTIDYDDWEEKITLSNSVAKELAQWILMELGE